jgi:hypothetical protein
MADARIFANLMLVSDVAELGLRRTNGNWLSIQCTKDLANLLETARAINAKPDLPAAIALAALERKLD